MDLTPQTPQILRPDRLPQTQPILPQEVWMFLSTQQQQKTLQSLVRICQQIIQSHEEVQHDPKRA